MLISLGDFRSTMNVSIVSFSPQESKCTAVGQQIKFSQADKSPIIALSRVLKKSKGIKLWYLEDDRCTDILI